MCGIFVLIENDSIGDETVTHDSVAKLLQHRGPDFTGHTIVINEQFNRRLTFVHTRLAINGASGSQPITNEDESLVLVINGEIFNWKELQTELDYKCTQSDCEIILPLYQKYKYDLVTFFRKLEGQFSFLLYDTTNSHVLIGRDRIGVTPLYVGTSFHDGKSRFAVASELKCLSQTLANGRSLVDNIKVFYPRKYTYCHINDIFNKGTDVSDYIDFFYPLYNDPRTSNKNLPKQIIQDVLKTTLHKSVRQQTQDVLQSNVEFGVLLSGGLDSSLIASLVVESAKNYGHKHRVKTFSIGVNGDVPDLVAARKVAKFLGTDHHEYHFSIEQGISAIKDVIWFTETYDCTTIRASTPMYLLTKLIKQDFPQLKVLYSGELADELFCYLYGANAPSPAAFQFETINLVSNVHMFDCLRANKSCMANSIEVRVPFTDSKLVDFVLSLDPVHKTFGKLSINGFTGQRMEKQLLRDAFVGYIPNDILYRKKEQFSDGVSGFNGKEDNWIDAIKDHTNRMYSDEEFCIKRLKYGVNSPDTKEKLYYRETFCELFCGGAPYLNTSELTVKSWEPKWSITNDPSGRVQNFWNKN